ncbi:MAG: hypothetical protein M3R41_06455 [Pseudomonadota bacterium]|nr:hypothetical protein [Pseudomonadota bacterium]
MIGVVLAISASTPSTIDRLDASADPVRVFERICMEGGASLAGGLAQSISSRDLPRNIRQNYTAVTQLYFKLNLSNGVAYLLKGELNKGRAEGKYCIVIGTGAFRDAAIALENSTSPVLRSPTEISQIDKLPYYAAFDGSGRYQLTVDRLPRGQVAMTTLIPGPDNQIWSFFKRLKAEDAKFRVAHPDSKLSKEAPRP